MEGVCCFFYNIDVFLPCFWHLIAVIVRLGCSYFVRFNRGRDGKNEWFAFWCELCCSWC